MEKTRSSLLLLIAGAFLIAGCGAAVVGGTAVVAAGTGTYFYINGELKKDYQVPFEEVWAACEKTVADMRGVEVSPSRAIGKGIIDATVEGEKIQFTIEYKTKEITSVAVRVGAFGDERASQRLQDKVGENLTKK